MPTTTKLKDYLGRWLGNATPGSTNATDHLGRAVGASNKDFIGRSLGFDNPANWVTATVTTLNSNVRLAGGQLLTATTAGTTGVSAPTAPAKVGGTVVDGTVTWKRLK